MATLNTATTIPQKRIMLTKSADWGAWLRYVEKKATYADIWDLVNPKLDTEPQALIKPTEHERFDLNAEFDEKKYAKYKAQKDLFKSDNAEYKEQRKNFADLVDYIYSSISAENASYIEKSGTSAWQILRALKRRLAPSDDARRLAIEREYHQICKGPKNKDIHKWIDDWVRIYQKAKDYNVAEVSGNRPARDFLLSLDSTYHTYSETSLVQEKHVEWTVDRIIEHFRKHIQLREPKNITHSFPTGDQSGKDGQNPSLRGKKMAPKCPCGKQEWWSECGYFNPDKRSSNWKPNPEIQKKIDELMEDNTYKQRVETSIEKYKDIQKNKEKQHQDKFNAKIDDNSINITDANDGCFPTHSTYSTYSVSSPYYLQTSWILDHGSSIHVCNATMRTGL